MDDPRIILERAAEQRIGCEILPRMGSWSRAEILRVERGGVVVLAPQLRLSGGEDVRCWFSLAGEPHTFEASVIRTGVPVPDRSQNGYLLGFIDNWTQGDASRSTLHGLDLLILPPNGPGISLFHGPGRLVELSVDKLTFTLPADHTLVFVAGGQCSLRMQVPSEPTREVWARIHNLVPGESHMLYSAEIEGVQDQEAHRRLVTALQRGMGEGPVG